VRNFETRIEKLEQLKAVTKQPDAPKVFIDYSDVMDAMGQLEHPEWTLEELIAHTVTVTTDMNKRILERSQDQRRG